MLNTSIQLEIKATVQSDKEFAVPFDDAWQWLQYSRKDSCKRLLVSNFEKNIDYLVFHNNEENLSGGRPSEEIYLSKDCFKQICMLANTERGKQVRLYFLQCEKELKEIKAAQLQQPTDILYLLEQSAAAIREARALAAQAEEKVIELAPKAESWERLCGTNGLMTIGEVAKNLAIPTLGPNKLFQLLRDKGYIYYDYQGCNVPKSTLVKKKYMKSVEKYDFKRDKKYSVCAVTYKGYEFIVRLLKRLGYISDTPTPNAGVLPIPYQVAA
ncbi:MAG: hypothetical protein HEQ20_03960 [Aphanizomenon flos-aquae KM1D3_PB]|nr:MAG: hypothetical protein HEQ20_03960 [Aphanizomenon flos-aquae KM1D3_PB]